MNIEDIVIEAIQNYAEIEVSDPTLKLAFLALADGLAAHLISELEIEQVWNIGYIHPGDGELEVDPAEMSDSTDRESVKYELRKCSAQDRLVTRLITTYLVDEDEPQVEDKDLVELVDSER